MIGSFFLPFIVESSFFLISPKRECRTTDPGRKRKCKNSFLQTLFQEGLGGKKPLLAKTKR
jgi:hypothetical protein